MTLYEYKVNDVVSVYDGDTMHFDVDLGFKIQFRIDVRLLGVDTPELRGPSKPQGIISRDYVRKRLAEATEIHIRTHKDQTGKYGRYLAEVFVDGVSLNKELLDKGLAQPYPHPATTLGVF